MDEKVQALIEAAERAQTYLAGYAAGIAMFGDDDDAEELATIDDVRGSLLAALSHLRTEAVTE